MESSATLGVPSLPKLICEERVASRRLVSDAP
jgi:hypothetical protein